MEICLSPNSCVSRVSQEMFPLSRSISRKLAYHTPQRLTFYMFEEEEEKLIIQVDV